MFSRDQIKADLCEVKYYYANKVTLDNLIAITGETGIHALVEKYNNAICSAPTKLYVLYGGLYLQNKTQAAVAIEMHYSIESIRCLIKELVSFFCKKFQEEV